MFPTRVLLAAPRGFCAGVVRAIDVVNLALECVDPPLYVRREIVHNLHVVRGFEKRGVRFVEELDEVPDGAEAPPLLDAAFLVLRQDLNGESRRPQRLPDGPRCRRNGWRKQDLHGIVPLSKTLAQEHRDRSVPDSH